ncbi:CRISPR-associated endonuclease Cas1 [Hypericibacter adhaerens]|jgi:CRISPR-associated protein Cas1|uniref:CRISPR-associated endonuclease Cas1 n=1 Tax=Hypericibacter adhaerens TaxID=2602016 RepID=A0A5J6N7J3_9PROT|nr:type II CRISPR-associated endonuclease Cas1 [Hypericibacter adhaerens]QEX24823.1 CRISPR-associated endonuclease Cas1 [Hypericibacter adhaerens]
MLGRIVEIAEDGRHLAVDRGFMTVSAAGAEIGRLPLDDIGVVIVNAHGCTYSNNLLVRLAERGAGFVVCAANHNPVAWLWPVVGHHAQRSRMESQIEAGKPLLKRLWQAVVQAKIRQQGAVLAALAREGAEGFDLLARRVGSGDPDNMEAQAARRYWPLLFGSDFRRDRDAPGVNAMLNYGYAILRSAAARAICASGLHPTIGLQHRGEDLALADDLMEPFRPIIDLLVARLAEAGVDEVSGAVKKYLAGATSLDMATERGTTPLFTCLERLSASLARSFEEGKPGLDFPLTPLPLELPVVPARAEA